MFCFVSHDLLDASTDRDRALVDHSAGSARRSISEGNPKLFRSQRDWHGGGVPKPRQRGRAPCFHCYGSTNAGRASGIAPGREGRNPQCRYEDELPLTAKADADGMRSEAARPITEIVLII